jgi:hypothetical protein
MFKFKIAVISVVGWIVIAIQAPAQITNGYPLTILETLESGTGQLVVKGSAPMGNVSFGSTAITVLCKEDYPASTGKKFYGILIDIKSNGADDTTVVDYDEMDALLQSIDYVSKVDWSVTSLSSFSAGYATKAGLRIAAFSSKRTGKIEFALHGSHSAKGILLSPDRLSQFYDLIAMAKAKIEELRKGAAVGQN